MCQVVAGHVFHAIIMLLRWGMSGCSWSNLLCHVLFRCVKLWSGTLCCMLFGSVSLWLIRCVMPYVVHICQVIARQVCHVVADQVFTCSSSVSGGQVCRTICCSHVSGYHLMSALCCTGMSGCTWSGVSCCMLYRCDELWLVWQVCRAVYSGV